MLKKLLFLGSLVLLSKTLFAAAPPNLDSLKQAVIGMPDDSLKYEALIKITELLSSGDEAEIYGRKALHLAKKLNKIQWQGSAYQRLAFCHTYDEMDKKIAYLDSATIIFNRLEDWEGLAWVYNARALMFMDYGSLEECKEAFQKAYNYFLKTGNQNNQAIMLNNLGVILNMANEPQEAIKHLNQALDFRLAEVPERPLQIGRLYFNLGDAAKLSSNLNLAVDYYLKAYQYRKKANHVAGISESLVGLANIIYEAAEQQEDTMVMLHKIQALNMPHSYALLDSALAMPSTSNRIGFKYQILNVRRRRQLLYNNYAQAYQLLWEQKKIDEEQKLSESSLSAFADLKNKYEQERLKTRLLEEEIINRKKQSQVNLLLFFLGIVMSILVTGFISYQNRIKANRLELAMKQQKLVEVKQEQQIIAMRSMLEGQEKERARIARDLHDGLGNLLSTLKVNVGSLHISFNDNLMEKTYVKASEMIDEACTEVRKIAHAMMPQALRRLGLKKALEDLCQKMDNTHSFNVHFDIYGMEQALDDSTNVMLYRIVQESFNNIVKYAEAKEVLLQLTFSENWLNLIVEDDGKGFEMDKIASNEGMGLKSISFRSQYIGGECEIDSRLGEGTLVSINIPLNNEKKKETVISS